MQHYLLYFLLAFLSLTGYAKGSSGKYYITGIAYDENKMILTNSVIVVRIGDVVKEVKTDDKGKFEFDVPWIYPCRSAISHAAWVNECKRLNPEFIYIKNGNIEIKIKNEWDKFAGLHKEKITKQEDLIFKE